MEEKEKLRSVLQSARANGECTRRPPGHLVTGAGREEVMRKGGGEELVAASKQFRRSRGEKSARLGLVALTVGPVRIRMQASTGSEQARGAYVGAQLRLLNLQQRLSVISMGPVFILFII